VIRHGSRFQRIVAGTVLTLVVPTACASPGAAPADPFPAVQALGPELVQQTLERGGFTVDPRTGFPPRSGYAVNTGTSGLVLNAAEFASGEGHSTALAQLTGYVRDNADAFTADPRLALGAWYDSGRGIVVLSLVDVVAELPEAISLGLAHHQQSVYDLAAGRSVPTGGPGR
jgi:hypothetical protein